MSRLNSRRSWPAWLLVLALVGCATTPRLPQPTLDPAQQRAVLLQLQDLSLSGSVGVFRPAQESSATPAEGFNASVDWRQRQDQATVKLAGPFGAGGLQVDYSLAQLRVAGRGVDLMDAEAEQMLVRELGFMPPFEALRYWIRGIPAPGSAGVETLDAAGLLQQLEQQGWLIKYERHVTVNTATGKVQLPGKMTATREGLRLTLVVYRWRSR